MNFIIAPILGRCKFAFNFKLVIQKMRKIKCSHTFAIFGTFQRAVTNNRTVQLMLNYFLVALTFVSRWQWYDIQY